MRSLYFSYNMLVDKAYIIRVRDNAVSEQLTTRCVNSCKAVDMLYEVFDGYDGTGDALIAPKDAHPTMSLIKISNHYLSKSEVACFLSHILLWIKCIEIDKPIVILEHDAVMTEKYAYHGVINSICYLGSAEQHDKTWQVSATPPHGSDGPGYHFLCRSHSYAVDPVVAKNLVAHVIKYGISASVDMFIRADIFPIHQQGLYAYDSPTISTIHNRDFVRTRNDQLER